jgi:hypothetical protein
VINGVSLSDVKFSLNDRSQMDHDILIGQDVLEAGKFVVDVTESELCTTKAIADAVTSLYDKGITKAMINEYLSTEII